MKGQASGGEKILKYRTLRLLHQHPIKKKKKKKCLRYQKNITRQRKVHNTITQQLNDKNSIIFHPSTEMTWGEAYN